MGIIINTLEAHHEKSRSSAHPRGLAVLAATPTHASLWSLRRSGHWIFII